jgi:hypothetical protein
MKGSRIRLDGVSLRRMRFLASFVASWLLASSTHPELCAAMRTWSGAGTNNLWSNASNWVEQASPMAGDDLVFPALSNRKQMQNDLPDAHLGHVTSSGIAYGLTGNSLLLDGRERFLQCRSAAQR